MKVSPFPITPTPPTVGSSDTHVAATSDREDNFFSKAGLFDGNALAKGSIPLSFFEGAIAKIVAPSMVKKIGDYHYFSSSSFETWGASGLAAVWAEENTRASIYAALRRKETFATSGPRIKLRFFASFDFEPAMLHAPDLVSRAYASGVSMGGDLAAAATRVPQFLVWAVRDEHSAPLQRVQIVKGYIVNGMPIEKIFDVACSDNLVPDNAHYRCPNNGAVVNVTDCSISDGLGADELLGLWRDPEFNSAQNAFYYVRVLENLTCRWSTWDAVRALTVRPVYAPAPRANSAG